MLTLPIKGERFTHILNGTKLEEYREDSQYYRARFRKLFDLSDYALTHPEAQKTAKIRLRNGYGADQPAVIVTCILQRGQGRVEWGAKPRKDYLVLRILAVEVER